MFKFDDIEKTPIIDLGNGVTVRLERDELDDRAREKAEKELRETDEIKKTALKEFTLLLSGTIERMIMIIISDLCNDRY